MAEIISEAAELVKLCFCVGLTQEQAAKELGASLSTAERLWADAQGIAGHRLMMVKDS